MARADALKPDNRTPQELAKAILDHEVDPKSEKQPSYNFRETLCLNPNEQNGHPLLQCLKCIEEGIPLTGQMKKKLAGALKEIDDYRRESMAHNHMLKQGLQGVPQDFYIRLLKTESQKRAAQDNIGDNAVAINNLNHIEKLMRVLAEKLGITLIEPTRGK